MAPALRDGPVVATQNIGTCQIGYNHEQRKTILATWTKAASNRISLIIPSPPPPTNSS